MTEVQNPSFCNWQKNCQYHRTFLTKNCLQFPHISNYHANLTKKLEFCCDQKEWNQLVIAFWSLKRFWKNSPPKHENVIKTWSKLFDISHCAPPKVYTHFFKAHSFLQWGNCHSFSRKSKHKLNVDNAADKLSVYSKSYHFAIGALL